MRNTYPPAVVTSQFPDFSVRRAGPLLVRAGLNLFSFETAYVLFIFAGLYKADVRLQWMPVDPTLLFFLLSGATAIFALFGRGMRLSKGGLTIAFSLFLFIAWTLISLSWSPSRVYGPEKAQEIAIIVLWAGLAPALIIAPDPVRFRRFVYITMTFVGLLALDQVIGFLKSGVNAFAIENYLGQGRAAGFATMMALVLISVSRTWPERGVLAIALALYLLVIWLGGGRGPMLAALFGVFVMSLGSVRIGSGILRLPLVKAFFALGVVSAIVVVWVGPESRLVHRLDILLSQQSGGYSAAQRLMYYEQSLSVAAEAPIVGHGLGGWPIAMGYVDFRRYPHNIVLECLTEGGAVGLVLLCLLLGVGLMRLFSANVFDDVQRFIVLLCFVNTFVNAQFSGDLSDNRILFATIGLMAVASRPLRGVTLRK